jgi:hypothetical protein
MLNHCCPVFRAQCVPVSAQSVPKDPVHGSMHFGCTLPGALSRPKRQ